MKRDIMKKLILFTLSVIVIGCDNGNAQQKFSPGIKKRSVSKIKEQKKSTSIVAPDFTLSDLQGKEVSLNDYKGKVVILNFWGTWCGPCRREIPDFIKLTEKYHDDGLEIVGITLTSGSPENIRTFSKKWNINYTLLTDIEGNETQKVTFEYGKATKKPISGIPTTFIIDRDGFIRKRYVGPRSEKIFLNDLKPYL